MVKLSSKSKRQPLKQKYRIQKKVKEHKRKLKKLSKTLKPARKSITKIPNTCPFKREILETIIQNKHHGNRNA